MESKTSKAAAIGAWLVAGAMAIFLARTMQEPTAHAAPTRPAATEEARGPEHAPPPPPAASEIPQEIPAITITAPRPRAAAQKPAAPRGTCRIVALEQEGRPGARTVRACD